MGSRGTSRPSQYHSTGRVIRGILRCAQNDVRESGEEGNEGGGLGERRYIRNGVQDEQELKLFCIA